MGKPLLILNPIPGREAANSDFLLERGAAVKINRVEDCRSRLTNWLVPGSSPDGRRRQKAGTFPRGGNHLPRGSVPRQWKVTLVRLRPETR